MLLISGIIVIVLGMVILLFSIYGRKNDLSKKKRCTSIADGTLVRFVKKETLDDRHVANYIFYYPIYEYTVDGKQYEIQSSYGSNRKDETLLGQRKKILYNPDNHEESFVSGEDLKNAFKIVKFFGILFLAIGILEILIDMILKYLF